MRLALTLASLIVAGAMFITVFTVRNSLFITLDQFAAYWSYDKLEAPQPNDVDLPQNGLLR